MRYLAPASDSPEGGRTIGVLLINVGTPKAATAPAIRAYLADFLSDRRVIERPRWQWLPILHGVILRRRPSKIAPDYAAVWSHQGSPLLTITQAQTDAVQQRLQQLYPQQFRVEFGMRYGQPTIADGLYRLYACGITRLLLLPLYPQYSAVTTASAFDAIAAVFNRWRVIPDHRFIASYYHNDSYLDAVVDSIHTFWQEHSQPERLLFSFHGLPRRYVEAGDPYYHQCCATANAVVARLGLDSEQWGIGFQSRVGPEPWLQPYTDETLMAWARSGIARVQVICPGFAADCLETLAEIGIDNRAAFVNAGGNSLQYIPALNSRNSHIDALVSLLLNTAGDWIQ